MVLKKFRFNNRSNINQKEELRMNIKSYYFFFACKDNIIIDFPIFHS
ncbi:hypothetical protein M096_2646 [Parabacteroides distasonis str. 3999B T(B) 6]|nr:hypothetical protein M096_2646 [Parabacteroides distasonis str. 3999B T(B) 6]